MAKWADFGVFRVKYDAGRTAIVELEVRADSGESFEEVQRAARTTVVAAIERGQTFVTVYLRDGKYAIGQPVRVVVVQGQKFLRTDGNSIKGDNLGALPEYV